MKNKFFTVLTLVLLSFLGYTGNFLYKLETGKLPPEVSSKYKITIPTDCTNTEFKKNISKKKAQNIM